MRTPLDLRRRMEARALVGTRARWFNNDGEWLNPPNPNHEETP